MSRVFLIVLFGLVSAGLLACGGGGTKTPGPIPPGPDNRTVSGTVTDSNGNPVPGLSVLIDGKTTGETTSLDGKFFLVESKFALGSSESYRLALGMGGVIFSESFITPADDPEVAIRFDVDSAETGILSGTVHDERTEEMVSDALIIAFAYSGGLFFTESGARGEYSMEIPAAHWLLLSWKEGYNPGVSSVEVQGGGESVQDIFLSPIGPPEPPAGMRVSGTVADSDTGAPVAGALVTMMVDTGVIYGRPEEPMPLFEDGVEGVAEDMALGMPYMPSYQETTTDASGAFAFEDDVVGYSAYFTVNAESYLPGNEWRELPGGVGEFVVDLTVQPFVMTSVSGRAVDEVGDPVPDAWIEFIFQGGAGGGYAMPMLDSTTMGGWVDDFDEAAGKQEGGGYAAMDAAPNAGSRGGNEDYDNPLFMQYLYEQRQNRGTSQADPEYFTGYFSVQADENGEFAIDELPAGPYYIFADAYRHLPFSKDVYVESDGSTEVEVILETVPVGSVEGRVIDEEGNPIPDVLVNCIQPNRDPFTFTDAEGYYRIDNIPASTGEWDMWLVSAYAVGYRAQGVEVFIGEDDVRSISFTLERYTPPDVDRVFFTGTVIDGTTGDPVEGARLYVVSGDNQYWADSVTDSKGIFTFNLVPTEYRIEVDAEAQGYQELFTWFWVDTAFPQMEFYLWPIGSNAWGGRGGVTEPGTPPPPEEDRPDEWPGGPGGDGTDESPPSGGDGGKEPM